MTTATENNVQNKLGKHPSIKSPLFKWALNKGKEAELVNRANILFPNGNAVDAFGNLLNYSMKQGQQPPQRPVANQQTTVKNIDLLLRAFNNSKV